MNEITVRKLKPFVLPLMYTLSIMLFVLSVYLVSRIINNALFSPTDKIKYVDDEIIDNNTHIPVVSEQPIIIRPYTDSTITIGRSFYDYKDDIEKQKNALIYYEGTYMQNSGVDYKSDNVFDVVSILDGTIINVRKDNILGNIVEVRHNNELISTYGSLSEVSVKVDDVIKQGQIIGKSGTNSLNSSLGNHLHFELFHQGKVVNPEIYYDKKVEEL